jgi:hypothetical protein
VPRHESQYDAAFEFKVASTHSRTARKCNNSINLTGPIYKRVFKSFRTGGLERELQIVELSVTRCCCIAILCQPSEFCRHNPLCCFSATVYCCKRIFRYRLSQETFGYTLVVHQLATAYFSSHSCWKAKLYS